MKNRRQTHDRASAGPPGKAVSGFLTAEQIGNKRHVTREGFLLCQDVPIARTGWMIYGPRETPIVVGDTGMAMVERDATALFSPQAIMSFVGKPVTNDHPRGGVSSTNWKNVAVGTAHNVRQGTGDDADVMLADLLITDRAAIQDILAGKVEVSAGYEADYEQTGVGLGRQHNILGNHIALVQKGRCGPRCAIGDRSHHQSTTKEETMPTLKNRRVVSDASRQLILDAAAALAEDEQGVDADEDGSTHIHIHNAAPAARAAAADEATMDAVVEARFAALEKSSTDILAAIQALSKAAPVADAAAAVTDAEGVGIVGDSRALQTSFQALLADAEILVPGFAVPTFDAAMQRQATVDSMCNVRRLALQSLGATTDGALFLSTLGAPSGTALAALDCAGLAPVFKLAAGAKKLLNNRQHVGDGKPGAHSDGKPEKRKAMTIDDLNEMHRKMHGAPALQQAQLH